MLKKWALGITALLLALPLIGVGYLFLAFPKVAPAANIKIKPTPSLLARGQYLANHVAVCVDCHSTRNWSLYSGPIVPGTEGLGGELFNEKMGLPGTLYSPNITPHALKSWTDGELIRAFTSGVTNKGKALFPLMPYPAYHKMSTQDAHAIVVYIRSLKPLKNKTPIPARKLNFPLGLIVRVMPTKAKPTKPPKTKLERGKYIAEMAGCIFCHTPEKRGQIIPSKAYHGGRAFTFRNGDVVTSTNLTPHDTGLGRWSKKQFIAKFKLYSRPQARKIHVAKGQMNTPMPWTMYAGMTPQDLGAIYAYLRTLKPAKNTSQRFRPAK